MVVPFCLKKIMLKTIKRIKTMMIYEMKNMMKKTQRGMMVNSHDQKSSNVRLHHVLLGRYGHTHTEQMMN